MTTLTFHTFSGVHHEIGVQQGRAVRELLHEGLEQIPTFWGIKLMKPRLLPTSLFLTLAKRRATKLMRNDIVQYYPQQAQRLDGIAEGAGTDVSNLLFFQGMELLVTIGESSYQIPACTSVGICPQRTASKETIVAKNFDYPTFFAPYHLLCCAKPRERLQTLGCTMVPSPGMIDGMNEHGLTVTYNLAYTTDKPECMAPLSLALQEMLETCKNTDEAVNFITTAKRAGNALLLLADAEGNIKTVEISSNHAETREPTNYHIVNTNHYRTPEMQRFEVPHNAVYYGKVPKAVVGERVHESSEQRLQRAEELLRSRAKINEKKMAAILRDHGKDNNPSLLTICSHSELFSTLRSVIFYPKRKSIKILYGSPCQNEYKKFTFS